MAALADLDVALTLLPDHVGALSGRALALAHLGETPRRGARLMPPWRAIPSCRSAA